ncbi:M56 family metallopeptidase [Geosporobacter ferrireducens]|uniref:Peptidase M56 domain-containing protein n=1 Tax=Geosporobacter ferrireducens TaxID=1424294 RepID=A0A1D8GEG0_9FIRM|nr:M56 family metallopeptidase [Geosporobacter ferrireducens]AOT69295.1 hypothetical protein Gferi_06755 [Geosporobacter ferrireducens]MTI56978.1 peptidase [Geosporobacter ferrireducens]
MTSLFTTILNMNITASYVVLAVIAIRLLFFKKAPKIFSYALWLPVWIRLVFPFSFNSSFSFLSLLKLNTQTSTGTMEYIPNNIGFMQNPVVDVGIHRINNAVNTSLPPAAPAASVNPMQIIMGIAGMIWVIVLSILLICSIISYLKVINNVKTATLVKDNIFETDRITAPFVCGFIKPKIFIPTGMQPKELSYILAHEQTHIERLDYLIKPFAFLVLVVHWFNPLIWLSFALMSKDMEMSCDENVLKKLGNDIRVNYSNSLLSLSIKRSNLLTASPLAFGESNIKSRIKNVLNYKKPTYFVVAAAFIVSLIFTIGFISNPVEKQDLSFLNAETEKNIAISSIYGEFQLAGNQISHLFDFTKWKIKNVPSLDERPTYIRIKAPFDGNFEIRFYDSEPSIAMVIREEEHRYYKIPESDFESIYKLLLATVWANALKTRDGQPRYEMMSEKMKEKFEQEQIDRADENWNFNIGVSSPWVVDFEVKLDGANANITYLTMTSEPAYYNRMETLTFGKEKGKLVVAGYQTVYEDKLIENNIVNALSNTTDTAAAIERYLQIILSSPGTSSNPYDYIKAHQNEYENILKMGDDALNYLLAQFEKSSNHNGLRDHIIMALCKDLLGHRNNVTDESLSPQDWFSELSPYAETKLPDFKENFSNEIEQLVYDAAIEQYSRSDAGFTVVAPTIFGSYEEGNKLKVFVTVFSNRYKLYDKTLSEVGGSVIPAAITYTKKENGRYTLDEYLEAMDGSYFLQSIKEYCIMPVSKKEIKGLYDKILDDYSSNESRSELLMKNLIDHLKSNNQKDIILRQATGEIMPLI